MSDAPVLTSSVLTNGPLCRDDEGEYVLALQFALEYAGYRPPLNGSFDADTEASVRALQTDEGLPITGVVEQATRDALQNAIALEHQRLVGLLGDAAPAAPSFFGAGDAGTCVVVDPKAVVRTPPPECAGTGDILPEDLEVELLETRKVGKTLYAKVQAFEGPFSRAAVWTSAGNLTSARNVDPAVMPDTVIPLAGLTGTKRRMAVLHNRYGGFLAELAEQFGYPEDGAAGVLAVESGGDGFNLDGTPVVRFENHQFEAHLKKMSAFDISRFILHFRYSPTKRWEGHEVRYAAQDPWEDFHGSQESEHRVLQFARTFDSSSALKAQSMGIVQIMGFNHLKIGYPDVETMWVEQSAGIRAQLQGFFQFVRNDKNCDPGLKARDYVRFARGYNGPGQPETYGKWIGERAAVYAEVKKLAVPRPGGRSAPKATVAAPKPAPTAPTPHHAPTQGVRPAPAAAPTPAPAPKPVAAQPAPKPAPVDDHTVPTWEDTLRRIRYLKGAVDGDFGAGTAHATRAFQVRHGLEPDGVAGPATFAAAGLAGLKGVMKRGSRGDHVRRWQQYLVDHALLGAGDTNAAHVVAATKALQALARLPRTGEPNADTFQAVKVWL